MSYKLNYADIETEIFPMPGPRNCLRLR